MLVTKWILIVVFSMQNGYDGIAMQEFETNAACVAASKKIIEMKTGYGGTRYACVEKSK